MPLWQRAPGKNWRVVFFFGALVAFATNDATCANPCGAVGNVVAHRHRQGCPGGWLAGWPSGLPLVLAISIQQARQCSDALCSSMMGQVETSRWCGSNVAARQRAHFCSVASVRGGRRGSVDFRMGDSGVRGLRRLRGILESAPIGKIFTPARVCACAPAYVWD